MKNKVNIIQSNLHGLKELYFDSQDFTSDELYYLKVIISFYQGDIEQLESFIKINTSSQLLTLMAIVRLDVIKHQIDRKNLDNLEKYIDLSAQAEEPIWVAEAHFILGWAYREYKDFFKAKKIFKKSYNLLWKIGAKKKAVKSLLNHVVCQTHIDPSKRHLVDFQFIAKKALEVNDKIVAGLCQLNMAREYRLLGSFELSFDLINKSVLNLEEDRGTNNYYFAVLERCHLLISLNRFKQAHQDYEIIAESNLKEIQEASKVILMLLGDENNVNSATLDPVWADVLKQTEHTSNYSLTKYESSLINFLSLGEKPKKEIIFHLYGEQINFESAENRFKVLLSRLRKKAPKLVSFSHGHYSINEGVILSEERTNVS